MIIVSPETHSSLFLIKNKMQKHIGDNITFDNVIQKLVSEHHQIYKLDKLEQTELEKERVEFQNE